MIRFIFIISALCVALSASETQAIEQDPSCLVVNNAYIASRSTNHFSSKIFEVKPKGSLKFYMDTKVSGGLGILRKADVHYWSAYNPRWTLDGPNVPKFSSCKLTGTDGHTGEVVYDAIWKNFREVLYEANAKIWIAADGKIQKVRRDKLGSNWMFSFDSVLEIFSYSREKAVIPDHCRQGCDKL